MVKWRCEKSEPLSEWLVYAASSFGIVPPHHGIHKICGVKIHWARTRGDVVATGKFEYWLTPDGLTLLEGWARNGLTDEQIAHNVGITSKTLREWKKRFGAICASLKRGKEVVDIEVENALFKRALGYDYEEIKTEETEKGTFITKYRRHIPPETAAIVFWLKNRKSADWRDKREYEANTETLEKLDQVLAQIGGTDNVV